MTDPKETTDRITSLRVEIKFLTGQYYSLMGSVDIATLDWILSSRDKAYAEIRRIEARQKAWTQNTTVSP